MSVAAPEFPDAAGALADRAHGLWAAGWFVLLGLPLWLVVAVSPAPTFAWNACRIAGRLWLRAAGIRLATQGLENLAAGGVRVLVANHSSYVDGIALVTALPSQGWRFVAKPEAEFAFPLRIFLRRFGCEFLARIEPRESHDNTERLSQRLAEGHSLAIFPEGGFSPADGLHSFRSGAFVAAAQNGAAVIPVALAGARNVLRDGDWLPRRGRISVTVAPPLIPENTGIAAALKLRAAARAAILDGCGEQDMQP